MMVGVKIEEETKQKFLCWCPLGQRDVTTRSSPYTSLSHSATNTTEQHQINPRQILSHLDNRVTCFKLIWKKKDKNDLIGWESEQRVECECKKSKLDIQSCCKTKNNMFISSQWCMRAVPRPLMQASGGQRPDLAALPPHSVPKDPLVSIFLIYNTAKVIDILIIYSKQSVFVSDWSANHIPSSWNK